MATSTSMSITGNQVGLFCISPLYSATVKGTPPEMNEQQDMSSSADAHVQFQISHSCLKAFAFIKDKSWEVPDDHIVVSVRNYHAGDSVLTSKVRSDAFKIFGKIMENAPISRCEVDFTLRSSDSNSPSLRIMGQGY